jgi:hypothetical protein
MNKALDKVRAEETGRMNARPRPGPEESRWLLLKRSENLRTNSVSASAISSATPQDRPRLPSPRKPSNSSGTTTHRCGQASSSTRVPPNHAIRIEPMKKIARSHAHRELPLNYFRAQKLLSSGVSKV